MSTTSSFNPWFMSPDEMMGHWQTFLNKLTAMPKVAAVAKNVKVGATPAKIVRREDIVSLMQYESDVEKRFETPLLFVFALVNRPYILDLRPNKSVIAHFVNKGFDTYNLDWGVPQAGDRHLGLKDYVLRYLDNTVDYIRQQTGQDKINLLGYCMGGTMTAIYAALRPEKVKNLILLTAPVDWSHKENLLSLWCDEKYLDIDKMLDVYGNAPPQWLQGSFLMLKPVQNLVEKYVNFWENMDNEKWLEDFFAMETWLNDNIPVAGEVFREFVKSMFQQNQLIKGELNVGGERVDLKQITQPILNLIAENDHLVPPNQSLTFNNAVGSTDRKTITFPAGHIGMAVGGKAHRDLWPEVCDWLAERSDPV